jgi:hypothetical protein
MKIKQGIDEGFLLETLTRDISPSEALFDLIDNAIDAARNSMPRNAKKDSRGLPKDYSKFKIAIRISEDVVAVSDNCDGFHRDTLRDDAFILGKRSTHLQGVGHFGLGMKRALLALGKKYALATNRSNFSATVRFNASDLSMRDDGLSAIVRDSRPATRTTFVIADLQPSAAHHFSGDIAEVAVELSKRYGQFIKKGLRLSLNGTLIYGFVPNLRSRGPVKAKKWHTKINGVDVFVRSGMHMKYRHTQEADYDRAINSELTEEFGWYIVCNDRTIEVASKEKYLGFSTFWHPEYNGFLGWVHFVSDDPSTLPWDTKKSKIDPNSEIFTSVRSKLEEFSDEFRTENRQSRKNKKTKSQPKKRQTKTATKKPAVFHINDVDQLLPVMDLTWNDKKLASLLKEASELSLEYSFSGAALLRMIGERVIDQHIRRSGRLNDVKTMIFDQQSSDGRPFSDEQKDNFDPTIRNSLDWLKKNKTYFPPENRSDCFQSLSKFANALKTINGVMHQATIIGRAELSTMRNEFYPLLDYLTANKPSK